MREITESERGYLWLSLVDGMSTKKKYELLDNAYGIEEYYLNFTRYTSLTIEIAGNNNFAKLNYYRQEDVLDKEIEKLSSLGIDFITIDDRDYPSRLRNIDTAPLLLYYKGDKSLLQEENMLSVVGTRTPSRYGKDACRSLVKDVAKAGITVVSGLARGIDTVSHRTTLENDGKTIAVVANGLDICYPSENNELKERIEERGLVLSEYPLGASPFAYRFPERNRIISGLSTGTLVVEAGRRSGSLITLGYAVDEGRNVYIVPGEINRPSCYGSNDALKQLQGAMVTESDDILKDYDVTIEEEQEEEIPLPENEQKLVDYIKAEDRHIDEISAFVGDMEFNTLLALLAKLELYGLIKRLPGNYYGK